MLKDQIMGEDRIIFKNQDARLIRDIMPDSNEKPMVVYHLYIRENSKMHETYADAAKELGYTYMDTDEYDGTYTSGSNYDHYYKFVES